MLNEMVKSAGCSLAERVKIAAAVVTLHNYDRTQDIIETAGQIKTAAAHNGVNMPDEMAIQASHESYLEGDMAKVAGKKWDSVKKFMGKPGMRIGGSALLGGGAGALGGAALAGDDDEKAKVIALAGLLGLGGGAFLGAKAKELQSFRGKFPRSK